MTSIFVAKLDFGVTSEDLKKAFQAYGTVLKATVATDRETGRSRGFGFVEMTDRDEAMNAIRGLDNSTMNGRQIAVKEAEQRQDNRPTRDNNSRPPREGGSNRPFQPRGEQTFKPRENTSTPPPSRDRDEDDEPIVGFGGAPSIDPLRPEPRKKVIGKDKEKKKPIEEDRSKKPKLSPYKKSGKMNRFMDDDDDDFDPESASLFDFGDEDDEWENDTDYQEDDDFEDDED